jgi:hypothetical protein
MINDKNQRKKGKSNRRKQRNSNGVTNKSWLTAVCGRPSYEPLPGVSSDRLLKLGRAESFVVVDTPTPFLPDVPNDIYHLLQPEFCIALLWSSIVKHAAPPGFDGPVAILRQRLEIHANPIVKRSPNGLREGALRQYVNCRLLMSTTKLAYRICLATEFDNSVNCPCLILQKIQQKNLHRFFDFERQICD